MAHINVAHSESDDTSSERDNDCESNTFSDDVDELEEGEIRDGDSLDTDQEIKEDDDNLDTDQETDKEHDEDSEDEDVDRTKEDMWLTLIDIRDQLSKLLRRHLKRKREDLDVLEELCEHHPKQSYSAVL